MKSQNKEATQGLKPKHIPQRSCIVCRDKRGKRELMRLVITDNVVEVDPRGKKAGRGAYLCPRFECWDAALKKGRLDYALRTKISSENRQALLDCANSLPKKEA